MKEIGFATLLVLLVSTSLSAQQADSTNLTHYTPSILLERRQIEIKQFNNFYTQTAWFDETGEKTKLNQRQTYFTAFTGFLYGVSDRFNIGVSTMFRSVRFDTVNSSPLNVFEFKNNTNARTAFMSIGPQIRWAPKKWQHFSIQSTLLFPIAPDLEGTVTGKPFLDFDAHQWVTQFFYDKIFANRFAIFAEADLWVRVNRTFQLEQTITSTPLKVFFGTFLSPKWGVYAFAEWSPFWGGDQIIPAFYTQTGGGIKHQLTKHLEIEAIYSFFPVGKSSGAGQSFNLGIRFLK
jgi:hypothetical protein